MLWEINTPAGERAQRPHSHSLWWAFLQNFLYWAQSQQFGCHRQDQGRCRRWIQSNPIHAAQCGGGSAMSFPWGIVSIFLQDTSSKAEVALSRALKKHSGLPVAGGEADTLWPSHGPPIWHPLWVLFSFWLEIATEKQTWECSSHLKSLEKLTCFLFLLCVS